MDSAADERITEALLAIDSGDGASTLDRVMPAVYEELREMAHRQLGADRPGHTLSTTALVHETYLRLADADRITARGRAYFFAAAARALRRVLIDYARRRGRLKRGGGVAPLTLLEHVALVDDAPVELLDLDRALDQLAETAERPARVVECRFFGGMSVEETAVALGVSDRTVKRDWVYARAWLFDRLRDEADEEGGIDGVAAEEPPGGPP